jgi:predicted ATPase
MLKKLSLLRDKVEDWNVYPFCVPVIRNLGTLSLTSRICFFAGENGSGKSTLLEAIAAHYGFGPEGGNRNFVKLNTTSSNNSIVPLLPFSEQKAYSMRQRISTISL